MGSVRRTGKEKRRKRGSSTRKRMVKANLKKKKKENNVLQNTLGGKEGKITGKTERPAETGPKRQGEKYSRIIAWR